MCFQPCNPESGRLMCFQPASPKARIKRRKRTAVPPNSVSSEIIELAPRILVSERSVKDVHQRAHLGCCTPRMIRNPGSPREVLYPWFFVIFSIIFPSSLAWLAVSLSLSSLCKVVLIHLFCYKSSALPAIFHRIVYSNKRQGTL